MNAFAITNPGLEEYSTKEISELIKAKTVIEDSVVLFDCDEQKLVYLCYKTQSLIKVCSLLEKIKMKKLEDLKTKIDFTKIISKNKTFRVKFVKQGDVSLSSQEVEPYLGEVIFNQFKGKIKASMDNPDYIVYVYLFNSNCYIGIDYSGFDLSKRDYRVFANPRSYHANINYILLKIAELKETDTLLDLFCLSGETGIEAALYLTKRSPNYFGKKNFAFNKFFKFNFDKVDKEIKKTKSKIVLSSPTMGDVKCAQKNAKIASVEKSIDFTRQDIEWIDFKFKKKESVDKIVSNIPCPSANISEQQMKKVYDFFFFQVKELLSKKGKVVVLGKDLSYLKKTAKNVKLKKEIKFMNGKDELEIAVFEK
ncbi:MAG: THUMP domain-containing protein [Nanoarchaeota archaeon]